NAAATPPPTAPAPAPSAPPPSASEPATAPSSAPSSASDFEQRIQQLTRDRDFGTAADELSAKMAANPEIVPSPALTLSLILNWFIGGHTKAALRLTSELARALAALGLETKLNPEMAIIWVTVRELALVPDLDQAIVREIAAATLEGKTVRAQLALPQ